MGSCVAGYSMRQIARCLFGPMSGNERNDAEVGRQEEGRGRCRIAHLKRFCAWGIRTVLSSKVPALAVIPYPLGTGSRRSSTDLRLALDWPAIKPSVLASRVKQLRPTSNHRATSWMTLDSVSGCVTITCTSFIVAAIGYSSNRRGICGV